MWNVGKERSLHWLFLKSYGNLAELIASYYAYDESLTHKRQKDNSYPKIWGLLWK